MATNNQRKKKKTSNKHTTVYAVGRQQKAQSFVRPRHKRTATARHFARPTVPSGLRCPKAAVASPVFSAPFSADLADFCFSLPGRRRERKDKPRSETARKTFSRQAGRDEGVRTAAWKVNARRRIVTAGGNQNNKKKSAHSVMTQWLSGSAVSHH